MSWVAASWLGGALLSAWPWQWLPNLETLTSFVPPVPHQEQAPERVTLGRTPAMAASPARPITLPDAVVLRALEPGRAAFLRCWTRTVSADPLIGPTKIRLQLEIDPSGAVVRASHDAPNEALGRCLTMVARGLAFAAPGAPALAEIPLFFQPS